MSIFLFSLALFMLAFYIGYLFGKGRSIENRIDSLKDTNEYLNSLMREVDRRKELSKLAKSRKRVSGRFVKE